MHYLLFWQKNTICEHRSVQLISLTTKSIPHQNNFTHIVSTSPSSQTNTFILLDTQTNWTAIFSWHNGGKKSSMHMWEQQDLWPGRQGRGQGQSKAGRDLPSQQHSPRASEQAEQVQWHYPGSATALHSPDESAVMRQGQAQARRPSQSQSQPGTHAGKELSLGETPKGREAPRSLLTAFYHSSLTHSYTAAPYQTWPWSQPGDGEEVADPATLNIWNAPPGAQSPTALSSFSPVPIITLTVLLKWTLLFKF